jgi:HK97 gp10 family phage protein
MAANQTGLTVRVVTNKLPTLGASYTAQLRTEVERAGRGIEAAGKGRCPVRTGTLQRSIHTVFSDNGLTATVGPSVDYGIYVEFGTRHMGARPYMRPAAELIYPKFADAVNAVLRKGG